jgi:hypothetical protein
LGSVVIDGHDVATADDKIDRAAFFYRCSLRNQQMIITPTHSGVGEQPIQWLFRG